MSTQPASLPPEPTPEQTSPAAPAPPATSSAPVGASGAGPAPRGRAPVRRPPGPRDTLATVTVLSPGRGRETVPVALVQGTLALDLAELPQEPTTPELRAVPGDAAPEHREVQVWAARFAQAIVEVLGGDRPVSQLLRWTNARVYADLDRRVRILGRTTPTVQRRPPVRPQVRSVHVSQPAPASVEVSVHVRHGHRSRALAARLELRGERWLCVALQLG